MAATETAICNQAPVDSFRICKECKTAYPTDYFYKKAGGRCKKCSSEVNKEYRRKNRKKCLEYGFNYYHDPKNKLHLKGKHYENKYGITMKEYNKIFSQQKGNCAICGTHQSQLTKSLHVDHDHDTKIVRGLLCPKCNTGIGLFNDNKELLKNAIDYLRRT